MSYRQTVATAYDAGVEEEYSRLASGSLQVAEYRLIVELLGVYILSGSVVIDIGSGPGRYAEHLLERNCKVGVVDLSAMSLKAFSDRVKNSNYHENIIFNNVSCATQLDWIAENTADAILLMGPLYHLINEEHRKMALAHCNRILKTNGLLFSIFLSPFPVLNSFFEDSSEITLNKENFISSEGSMITHTLFQNFQVPQFRCWPDKAESIMKKNNFETVLIRNIEEIGTYDSDQKISGITHQYIVISRKL